MKVVNNSTRWNLVATLVIVSCGHGAMALTKHPQSELHVERRAVEPQFSWHTVPVFAESSNVSGPFDADAVASIAKFRIFVAEKAYNFPAPGFAEDKLGVLTRQLRAANPDIFLIFYYNANLDLTDYRLHTVPHYLKDDSGKVFKAPVDSGAGARPPFPYNEATGGVPVYDFTVPAMRDAWVNECFNATSANGGFDGCMVDRWTRTPFKNGNFSAKTENDWTAARNLATSALAQRANTSRVWLVGEGPQVNAISDPGFGYSNSVSMQMQLANKGTGLLASYRPGSVGANFMSQLAMFLIGAGEHHYFGAGSWTCNHTSREGVTWHPEYDRPLGEPLGPAKLAGNVYTRRFSYGTNVTFDTKSDVGAIDWGVFPRNAKVAPSG